MRFWHVYLGGSLVASRRLPIGGSTETTTYRHTDALGSPIAATNDFGSIDQLTEHEPYGRMLNRANDNRPGYTGHMMDKATDLVYMQQRYYDPGIGRFLSVDPVTAYSSPISQFHRYRYANNNPYKFADPDGRRSVVKDGRIHIQPEDKTVPAVTLPNNVGAAGVSPTDKSFHAYEANTTSSLTPAQAGTGIRNDPTPGNDKPASPTGTKNDAGYIPVLPGANMVRSYSVPSPDASKYTDITVNYTIAGEHKLNEGFVVRFGEIGADGSVTLRSYGEGNSWRQGGVMEGLAEPQAIRVWEQNHQDIVNNAR